jgi:hypothetical protein
MSDEQYGQGTQGGQQPDQSSQQYGQTGQPDQSSQGGQGGQLDAARQQAQQQADQAIDQYASKIPGGEQLAQQAKDTVNQELGNLEDEAKKRLGGMFGQ